MLLMRESKSLEVHRPFMHANCNWFYSTPNSAAKGSKGTRTSEGRGKGDDGAQQRTWMRVKRQQIQAFRAIIEAMAVKNHV